MATLTEEHCEEGRWRRYYEFDSPPSTEVREFIRAAAVTDGEVPSDPGGRLRFHVEVWVGGHGRRSDGPRRAVFTPDVPRLTAGTDGADDAVAGALEGEDVADLEGLYGFDQLAHVVGDAINRWARSG